MRRRSSTCLRPGDALLLAPEISVIASVTQLNLHYNSLKDEGVTAICKAVQSNKETKLASLIISANEVGPVGAKAVAAMAAVVASLTSLDLYGNQIGTEGAKALAPGLAANGSSMTRLDVRYNVRRARQRCVKRLRDALGLSYCCEHERNAM